MGLGTKCHKYRSSAHRGHYLVGKSSEKNRHYSWAKLMLLDHSFNFFFLFLKLSIVKCLKHTYCISLQKQGSRYRESTVGGVQPRWKGQLGKVSPSRGHLSWVLLDKKEFVRQRGLKQVLRTKGTCREMQKQHGLLREIQVQFLWLKWGRHCL